MATGVKFIRVHGRVVPVKDRGGASSNRSAAKTKVKSQGYKGDPQKDYGSSFRLGAVGGVLGMAGLAGIRSNNVAGLVAGGVAGAASVGLSAVGIYRMVNRTVNQKKGKRAKTFFGHYLSTAAGGLAGNAVGAAGIAGISALGYGMKKLAGKGGGFHSAALMAASALRRRG